MIRQREWPKTPRGLTAALKRLAPTLRATGIGWVRPDRASNARFHRLFRLAEASVTTVTTVTTSPAAHDGPRPNTVLKRDENTPTVTPARARDDDPDGHDGPTAGLFTPRPDSASRGPDEELTLWTA